MECLHRRIDCSLAVRGSRSRAGECPRDPGPVFAMRSSRIPGARPPEQGCSDNVRVGLSASDLSCPGQRQDSQGCTQLATIRTPHHQQRHWSRAQRSGCRATTPRSVATGTRRIDPDGPSCARRLLDGVVVFRIGGDHVDRGLRYPLASCVGTRHRARPVVASIWATMRRVVSRLVRKPARILAKAWACWAEAIGAV